MPSTCVFEFDRSDPIYYSGESIKGRILLNTTKEKAYREIYIHFIGEAKTRWAVHKAVHIKKKRLHYTITYKGQETYIHCHKTLHSGQGVLSPGTHEYSFSVALPPELPSSCEEALGHISYEISLVIDRSDRFNNIFRQPLTVLRELNLNALPEAMLPIKGEDRFYFCCWPCKSGPVLSTLNIPFGGYAPGQDITFSLHIKNRSKIHNVSGVKLRFIQTYTFISRTPRIKIRKHSIILAETLQKETILRSTEGTINGSLPVPPVPPTTHGDFYISVEYHMEMIFGASCRSFSKIIVPITIGTIPLLQSIECTDNMGSLTLTPSPDTPDSQPPSYKMFKPPSYEKANTITEHFVDLDVDKHSRIEGFVPKYPMYANFSFSSTSDDLDDVPKTSPF